VSRTLKIVVADDDRDTRDYLREMLSRLGHEAVAVSDGRQLVEMCQKVQPDLVITDVRMPDMDGIQAADAVNRDRQVPVILVTAHHGPDVLSRAVADHIFAYLVKPVNQADIEAAIALAMLRFDQFQAMRKEAADLRQALEDRKVIERAKGIIMRRLHWDELDAFRRLRKLANDQNRRVVEVAQAVYKADEIFQALEKT
jgi:response regulator NasT